MKPREILLASSILVAGCSADTAVEHIDTTVHPPITASPTTSLLQDTRLIEVCLDNIDAGLYEEVNGRLIPKASDECIEFVMDMYDELAQNPMMAEYLDEDTLEYNDYVYGQAAKYQEASGIITTHEFDDQTVRFMYHDLEVLSRQSEVLENAKNEDPTTWTREMLVDRMLAFGVFNVKYPLGAAPRTDLLNDQTLSPNLLMELNLLTHWAITNDVHFNLLIVRDGHSETTLSGNVSDHVLGQAFDIRPYNGALPMPVYDHESDRIPAEEFQISSYPDAVANGETIMTYLSSRASSFKQVIWTEATTTIQGGVAGPNISRGEAIDRTHYDHIHIAVS